MIARVCTARGFKYKLVYNAGAAFGVPTVDVTGVIAGWPVAIELKRFDGKGKLTGRQRADLTEFDDAGAATWVVDSERSMMVVEGWLMLISPSTNMLPLHWTNSQ